MTTTLLAVDDSKTMRKVLEITFAGEDYRTVLAENPADALHKLRSEKPAIALVDAQLGTDSGYDLCQSMKRERPNVPVLILSSKQQPYDRARGASVGADDFMDKPFDTQQLIDKVAAVIRKAAEAPAAARPVVAVAAAAPPAASRPAPQPMAQTLAFGTPAQTPAAAQPAPRPLAAPVAAPASRPQVPIRAYTPTPVSGTPVVQPAQPRTATPTLTSAAAVPAPAHGAAPAAPRAATPAAAAAVRAGTATAAEVAGVGLVAKLHALGLTEDQMKGVLALSREVIEQVVWEVVPVLAETMIQEEIKRLTRD